MQKTQADLFAVRSNNVTIKDCKIIGSYQAVKGDAVGDRVGISIFKDIV